MSLNLAIAPCSWGIEDPGNPDNPPWNTVMDEAGQSGFAAMELGPYGYLPTDVSVLKKELAKRDLSLIAGTIYDDLSPAGDIEALKDKTRKICALLSDVTAGEKGGYLVILDNVKADRNNTAGHSDKAPRSAGLFMETDDKQY